MKFSLEKLLQIKEQLTGDFNISETADPNAMMLELAACINYLIQYDLSKLYNILYRIDLSEHTVRTALQQQSADADAGSLLAELIIERQLQKQEMRQRYTTSRDIPDDEKW